MNIEDLSPGLIEQVLASHGDEGKEVMAARALRDADAYRQNALSPNQGQMVSGHYISPGWGGAVRQFASGLAGGYAAQEGQQGLEGIAAGKQARSNAFLQELLKRRRGGGGAATAPAADIGV